MFRYTLEILFYCVWSKDTGISEQFICLWIQQLSWVFFLMEFLWPSVVVFIYLCSQIQKHSVPNLQYHLTCISRVNDVWTRTVLLNTSQFHWAPFILQMLGFPDPHITNIHRCIIKKAISAFITGMALTDVLYSPIMFPCNTFQLRLRSDEK